MIAHPDYADEAYAFIVERPDLAPPRGVEEQDVIGVVARLLREHDRRWPAANDVAHAGNEAGEF